MLDWIDIIVRLGAAMLIGSVLGLDRELRHQPAGMRTHGLVALGSALGGLRRSYSAGSMQVRILSRRYSSLRSP
jgi:putative Mg2+ transporter-C (MgtC) family protein